MARKPTPTDRDASWRPAPPADDDPRPPYIRICAENPRGRATYTVIAPDGVQIARLEIDADLWRDRYKMFLWDVLQDAIERHESQSIRPASDESRAALRLIRLEN